MINIKKLNKSYDKNIIKDLNLEIKEGDFCVILGESGCGKSTLLEIIAGLEDLDSGEIFFKEKNITNLLPSKREVSMIFQDYALYPNMNVYNNIEFALKIKKVPKEVREEKVLDAINLVGLNDYLKKYPHELSGGQRQRVAIARALVTEPKVFLMDEPLSNLDTNLKDNLRKEIISIHKKIKATTIYVTHDKNEAINMADNIVILNKGNIEQKGTPEEVLNTPRNSFVFKFLNGDKNIFKKEDIENIFNIKFSKETKTIGIKSSNLKKSNEGKELKIIDIKLEEDRKIFLLENNFIFKSDSLDKLKIGDSIHIKIEGFLEFDKKGKTI